MQAFNKTVALRPSNFGRSMFNILQLQEQFVRTSVGPSAEFSAVVTENSFDTATLLLKEGQNVVVEHLDRRQRHLIGIESAPGVTLNVPLQSRRTLSRTP